MWNTTSPQDDCLKLVYTIMIKELATFTGGQPVLTADLAFIQDAFKKAIICMNKAIGDTYILYGSLSGTSVVEGAVVIEGDVYKVPALGEIGTNKLCFRKKESSLRTFKNAQEHNVYVEYEAYLSTDTSGAVAWIDLKTAAKADTRIEQIETTIEQLESSLLDVKDKLPVIITSSRIEKRTESGTFNYIDVYIEDSISENDLINLCINITFNSSIRWLNCTFPAKENPDLYDVFAGEKQVGVGYEQDNKRIRILDRSNSSIYNAGDEAKMVIIKG